MFSNLLKILLIMFGFLLMGFGVGMIIAENFGLEENWYWLITVAALILGGFFSALGIAKRKKLEEGEEEEMEFGLEEEEEEFGDEDEE